MSRATSTKIAADIATVRKSWAAWNANDWEALEAYWEPQGEVIAPEGWPEAGSNRGWGSIRRQFERLKSSWERERVEEVEIEPVSDQLLVHGRWITEGHSSGVTLETDFWMLCRIRDGRFARAEYFFEREAAEAAKREAAPQ